MMRFTIPTLTFSLTLILASGLTQSVRAQETDEPSKPTTPTQTLEDYLKQAAEDSNDTLFSSPTVGPKTEANSTTTDAATVDAPKRLPNTLKGLERPATEPESLSTESNPESADTTKKTETPDSGNIVERKPTPPLTPELLELREQVRDCLGYYYNDLENVVDHSPWGIMHVLIAYGVDTQVLVNGTKTNAIGYLCWNGSCRGQQLFYMNRGKMEARLGPGVQGHAGQFLAMMAQSRVRTDYPMIVEGQDLKLADLIEYEKRTCEAGTELTFKLIGLAHYLDTDTTWKNVNGEDWGIPRLIKEELAQPIVGAACGGTHRLMGFNYAVRKREKEGKPITGQYLRARKFLDDYFEYTFYLQNPDGSFSTDFFRGRNSYGDINQRVETSGHILEWFVASLSGEQLRDPRVIKAVDYLTKVLLTNRTNNWEIGPKGHALHALAIYDERVFGGRPGSRTEILSRSKKLHVEDLPRR